MELAQDTESLLIVALLAQFTSHLDLILDLLGVMHDENGEDALGLDGLAIWSISRGRVDHDLRLLDGCNHLRLLHGLEHASGLLDASRRCHVHLRSHTCRSDGIALSTDIHLLLGSLLVVGTLVRVLILVVESLGMSLVTIDNRRFSEWTAHLARDSDLLDHSAVHRRGCLWVSWHLDLLCVHVLLMLVLRRMRLLLLALVHATTWGAALVHRLAQLMDTVCVCAVVRVWACLACLEMLAHDSLVVFEATLATATTSLALVTSSVALVAATATSATTTHALEAIVIDSIHITAHASTTLAHTATASTAELVEALTSIVRATAIRLVIATLCAIMTTTATIAATILMVITGSATALATTTSMVATTAIAWATLARTRLVTAALVVIHATVASTAMAGLVEATARVDAHVLRDRIIDTP